MAHALYPFKLFIKKLSTAIPLGTALLLHLGVWGWLAFYIRPQEEPIFLHYNVLFGVDLTGEWYYVFSLPLVGAFVIIVNSVLAWFLYTKDSFASYVLLTTTVIVHVFLVIVAALLVFLNV